MERKWYPAQESRVRRVYSALLTLPAPISKEPRYQIEESSDFLDLVFYQNNGIIDFVFRFDKSKSMIAMGVIDYAPVADIVDLYAQSKGESFLDNYTLYSDTVDKFAEVANQMGVTVLKNHCRPNISEAVLAALFNPNRLPEGNAIAYLLPTIE